MLKYLGKSDPPPNKDILNGVLDIIIINYNNPKVSFIPFVKFLFGLHPLLIKYLEFNSFFFEPSFFEKSHKILTFEFLIFLTIFVSSLIE